MGKLLVICGPTATGKTTLGILLAKKFKGEIVSADSRQVYRGMDIGTGKDLGNVKCQMSNVKSISNDKLRIGYYLVEDVKLWLYDIVEPDFRFSVADYVKCVNLVIRDIWKRKKLPILVGGTGFYIKGLIDGIESLGMPPDWELREKLQNHTVEELQNVLERTCPERLRGMNESDRKNPRRLVRAIEIARWKKGNKVPSSIIHHPSSILMIGLKAQNKTLYQRIDERVEGRVKQGIVGEIQKLLDKGCSWENSVLGTTIGYQEWQPLFEKKSALEDVIKKWKFAEHGYARRQMTWFKKALRQAQGKDKQTYWFDITNPNFEEEIEKLVSRWYNSSQYANTN